MEEHFYVTSSFVIIHHAGYGTPSDSMGFLNAARYSAGIGVTKYELRRPPETSFITDEFGHRALQVCISGNRDLQPVTDNDIELIRQCCLAARAKGWISQQVTTYFHGDWQATACPGLHMRERRAEIVAAVNAVIPVIQPKVEPMFKPPVTIKMAATLKSPNGGVWVLQPDGAIFALEGAPYAGGANGQPYFVGREAARLEPNVRGYYDIIATSGERYSYPV